MRLLDSLRTPVVRPPAGRQRPPVSRAMPPRRLAGVLAGLLLVGTCSPSARACATCGCTLSTDAATGYSTMAGWRLNLEDTYLDQDQLRHGSGRATPAQVVDRPSDPAMGGGEIEKDTINRYLTLGVAYRFDADWGVSLSVPWVRRDHTTYGMQMQPYAPSMTAPDQVSGARVAGLGDIKLIGDYQGFLPMHNLGVQFGVKLPTGRYGGQTEDGRLVGHPVSFRSGPAAGEALDTSLQAGTGSTDLIVGAYYYQPVSQDFDAFVSGQFQAAIARRLDAAGADYRPGNQASLSVGLRYEAHADWVPQLQLNWLHKMADQGALADAPNTAGTVAYLSPGISASLSRTVQAYAFVQVPVYRHLQGYQLFPGWTGTLGLSLQL
ncbi:transporter [Rhodanobacter aciditrophus]|uniref:transporter n=1 Tax=Rhodanobacter aciditrophus TaxID=1623218 RepID=UPI003CF3FB00